MAMRCKDGDLALVIYDEESCVDNIGKLVKVAGPLAFNSDIQKQCWLIESINPEPWYCTNFKGEPFQKVVTFVSMVEHPDDWLTPLCPSTDNESEQQFQSPGVKSRVRSVADVGPKTTPRRVCQPELATSLLIPAQPYQM